jgi:DNA helicase-2/ATP-dependent DNA helicase PcrA
VTGPPRSPSLLDGPGPPGGPAPHAGATGPPGSAGPEELLADLDADQRTAVTCEAEPLAVIAPAGSGKTRVLTRRIAWQVRTGRAEVSGVLAVTFTRKAAAELRARLARLGIQGLTAGTFHAVALAQLHRWCEHRRRPMPELLTTKAPLLARIRPGRRDADRLLRAALAAEIEWARARRLTPEAYPDAAERAGRDPGRPLEEVARDYRAYETLKRRGGLVDFDDLIDLAADAFEPGHGDEAFAAAERFRFRHLFVDEFQDVTPAQLRLVRAWLGGRSALCVVGDPDQAIYGFAGADGRHLAAFADHFPGGEVVPLGRNYRSSPQVVTVSRAVLPRPRPVRAARGDGPVPEVLAADDEHDEARRVAALLTEAHRADRPWRSMAVLFRTNAQSVSFERALAAAGIPHRVRGGTGFLQRPEVRAGLDVLARSAAAAPRRPFGSLLDDLDDEAARRPEEWREHLEQLGALGAEYAALAGAAGTVAGFRAYLASTLRTDADAGGGDGVDLVTFHRAKGLEWDVVVVTGLEQGLVPIAHAQGRPDDLAEERRLAYVALSRARERLVCTWAARRALGRRTATRRPSGLLREIDAARRALSGAAAAGDRTRPPTFRPAGAPDPSTRALTEELAAWRRAEARAAQVPAYVIFDNRTLDELVRRRPRTRAELAACAGMGPTRLTRHGDALLAILARHPAGPSGQAGP